MTLIRISEDNWAEVWKVLTSIGPITRVSIEPIYEIGSQHLEALCLRNLFFEIVNQGGKHAQVREAL